MNFRIGHGFDVHRLVPGRTLWLGGVEVPFIMGLAGHSDADVLIHAICDSLLGALAMGDIGQHFPDSDEEYRDIDSKLLLKKVYALVKAEGWSVVNLDTTMIVEEPKVSSHIPKMRKVLARILETDLQNISIKATTSETLGPEGRGEGISAHAVVLLSR
ncbi:MAG: 2-C-methyl-D-erythritol 2,4-cyclodiphosphate synthase [Bacteroidales bacterium]|jgi:2-C-methyl-D-erythritol 2,4-cyclodiphosphate synthase|nr:2-C-methyl-D-erythritol 2,4-cyclodiphosphate synthase [Bacteroidales bacterium]